MEHISRTTNNDDTAAPGEPLHHLKNYVTYRITRNNDVLSLRKTLLLKFVIIYCRQGSKQAKENKHITLKPTKENKHIALKPNILKNMAAFFGHKFNKYIKLYKHIASIRWNLLNYKILIFHETPKTPHLFSQDWIAKESILFIYFQHFVKITTPNADWPILKYSTTDRKTKDIIIHRFCTNASDICKWSLNIGCHLGWLNGDMRLKKKKVSKAMWWFSSPFTQVKGKGFYTFYKM